MSAKYLTQHATNVGFALHHVQLSVPPGSEEECRHFWVTQLGFIELAKPPVLAPRGGIWVRADNLEIHIGVEEDFRPAKKAHPGILVNDIDAFARRAEANGIELTWDEDFPGFRRCYTKDNVGNRLEFLSLKAPTEW